MELIDFKSSCKDCCNSKTKIEACASGKPIIIFLDESAETPTVKYFSLLTGESTATAPAHLTIGNCNDLICCGSTEEVIQGEESPAVGDAAPTGSKLFFDTVTQKITRANVDGVWVEIADSSLSFSDTLAEGNKILTITDSDGNETEVFESVTNVTAITDGFSYKNEAGEDKDITFIINDTEPLNTKVEVKLNGTTVAEFPLYTVDNDIQINNAGSEWDLTDDQITIVETNGDTQVLNFPYRVTVVANPDGTIDIKQNGVTIGTVPAAEPETVTTMTDVKATGDLIGTYTNEEGDEVEIRQSITSIGTITYDSTNGLLTIPHTDETGTVNNKTVTLPRPLNVLTTTQATPTPTGNTQNLNSTFKDAQGNTWIVDHEGHAILAGSAPFKELNQFHVCKAGNNTTGTGADENPFLTVQKGIDTAGQADAVIVTEGTYAEAITIATQNLTVRGEGQEYGGLTEVNSIAVTANGTSVRVSALTSTGAITHSGTSPLYLSEMTVIGNFTSSTTAYTEIKDSRLQDGTISKTAAGILFIQDSLIGNATFSTANSVISMRNVTIDVGDCVTIGPSVVYNMQDVVGCVVIDAAAIPLETAILAQGGTAEQAKAAQTSNFNMIRLLDPDTEASPTKIVTWDEVTKRLEVSDLSAIAGAPSVTFGTATPPTGGTPKEGDEYFRTSTGTSTGEVTEQWIYDATTSSWIKRPSSVSYKTTSLTPVYGTGTAYVGASNTALATVADQMRLADGSIVDDVDVTWEGHGLTVHAWYYLDAATGGYTTVKPTTGYAQQLFFVKDANSIHIDVEQATDAQVGSSSSATVTYGTTAPTGTAVTGSEYFITTTGTNGGTITASYIFDGAIWKLRDSGAPTGQNVYFNSTDPATGTIFDIENPPVTNDDALKQDSANTYFGTDGSVWTWNGTAYVTKTYNYPVHQREVFLATANQTGFTLSKVPIGGTEKVHVTRNGQDISDAFTWVGANGTYNPASNYSCTLDSQDKLIFHFEAF